MLVLNRKPGEKMRPGADITIVVVEVRGNRVRVGIDAPDAIHVLREELRKVPAGSRGRSEPKRKETLYAAGNSEPGSRHQPSLARLH